MSKKIQYKKIENSWRIVTDWAWPAEFNTKEEAKDAYQRWTRYRMRYYKAVAYRRVKKYNDQWCVCYKGVPDTNMMYKTEKECKESITRLRNSQQEKKVSEDDDKGIIPTIYKQDLIDELKSEEPEKVVPKDLAERSLLTALLTAWENLKNKYQIARDFDPCYESETVVIKGYTPLRFLSGPSDVPKKLEKETEEIYDPEDDDNAIYYKLGFTLTKPYHVFVDVEIREDWEQEREVSTNPEDSLESTTYAKVLTKGDFHNNVNEAFQKLKESLKHENK